MRRSWYRATARSRRRRCCSAAPCSTSCSPGRAKGVAKPWCNVTAPARGTSIGPSSASPMSTPRTTSGGSQAGYNRLTSTGNGCLMLRAVRWTIALTLGVVAAQALAAQDLARICTAAGKVTLGQWATYVGTGGQVDRETLRLAIVGSERHRDTTLYWFEMNRG